MVMSRLMHVTRMCDAHACVHACVQGMSCAFKYREARHRSAAGSLTHSPLTLGCRWRRRWRPSCRSCVAAAVHA